MTRTTTIRFGGSLFLASVFTLATATTALAVKPPHAEAMSSAAFRQEAKELKSAIKDDAKREKFATKQIAACERIEDKISNRMKDISNQGQKRLAVLDAIAAKVKDFYQRKGYVINEYDELLNEVSTSRQAAVAASALTSDFTTSWNCQGNDAKAIALSLRDTKKLEVMAMKEYQEAVRNLLVAVKSTASQAPKEAN